MTIPEEIKKIINKMEGAGFEAYLVGGCVRDLLLGRKPKDWDITTDAKPEEIQKLFEENFYENNFGTVSVLTETDDETLKVIEITPYRLEGKYTDKRRPDKIKFSDKLEDDLSRRDFTINSIAMSIDKKITDLFDGKKDLEKKLIRAVGDPKSRFDEDALRMLRAVRLAVELDFQLEKETAFSIQKMSKNLGLISKERIKDELIKIIMCKDAERGIRLLEKLNLLGHIFPEMLKGINVIGVTQFKKSHIKYKELSVFEHSLKTLAYTAENNFNLETRLAALLHDIAKPKTKRGEGLSASFKMHEQVGARMTRRAMEILRFPEKMVKKVSSLVRWHFFFYDIDKVSEAGVRRLIRNVGPENVEDLLHLRQADRSGSGIPKISSYRLKHLEYMIEKVSKDPIEPKMLKLKGEELMNMLDLKPGPRVGWILNSLLEDVLDDPQKNDIEYLKERAMEISKLSDVDLKSLFEKARKKRWQVEMAIDKKMREKHRI